MDHPNNSNDVFLNHQVCFDKTQIIGKGTYGVVYKGYHAKHSIPIAVKFIKSEKKRD